MNDDELRQRLVAADPATPSPADSWIPDLVEATMNTPIENDDKRRPWLAPVVAAAAVAVLAVGGFAVLSDDEPDPVAAEPTTLTLAVPDADPMTSICMPFEPDQLKAAEVAFSGTVVAVDEAAVTLDVDRWYRGGDADRVVLEHSGAAAQVALDGIAFEDGERYLVTAADGTVGTCGSSGPWTPEFAAQFEEALGP